MSLSRFTFTNLIVFTAFMATGRLTDAAVFSSGTHTVESAVAGIYATGLGTTVTINAPAVVTSVPGEQGSVIVDDGAHVIINGGLVRDAIRMEFTAGADQPTIDIFGGTFDHLFGAGVANVYGGTFQGQAIAGAGQLNVYGGTFGGLGYDSSSDAQVNVHGRSFDVHPDDAHSVYDAYPDAEFPIDKPGESFSMTDGQCCLFGTRVIGEAVDGSLIEFSVFLDGDGSVNLIVVPEPSAVTSIAFALLLSSTIALRNWRKLFVVGCQ